MKTSGFVNDQLEARCLLRIRGNDGSENEIETVIDTGFNGFLTLPGSAVADLELPLIGEGRVVLANGQDEIVNLFELNVFWRNHWQTVEVDCAETDPLLGMAMLENCRLGINVHNGGSVTVDMIDLER